MTEKLGLSPVSVLTVLLTCCCWVWGQSAGASSAPAAKPSTAASTQSAPSAQEIAAAIKDLSSEQWKARERASAFLRKAGRGALAPLRRAAASSDTEVATRAKDILADMNWDIFPDTPKSIVDAVAKDRATKSFDKWNTIQAMKPDFMANLPVLMRIVQAEEDPQIRNLIVCNFPREFRSAALQLIVKDDLETAETLLEIVAFGGNPDVRRDYVAFLLVTGKIDARIAELSDAASGPQAQTLVMLHYAKGDLKSALEVARKKNVLLREMLIETGDWKALAAMQDKLVQDADAKDKEILAARRKSPSGANDEHESEEMPREVDQLASQLGWQLSFHCLAGDQAGCGPIIDRIMAEGAKTDRQEKTLDQDDMRWQFMKVLLLNDLPDRALELLTKRREYAWSFDLLVARHQYDKALNLAPEPPPAKPDKDQAMELNCKIGKLMYELGRKEQGLKKLKSLLNKDCMPREKVIGVYRDLGLADQADELMAQSLAIFDMPDQVMLLEEAEGYSGCPLWWPAILKQYPRLSIPERLAKLRQVQAGKLPAKELDDLVAVATTVKIENPKNCGNDFNERDRYGDIVNVLIGHGRTGDSEKYAVLWADQKGLVDCPLTEVAAAWGKRGQWVQAAQWYGKAFERSLQPPPGTSSHPEPPMPNGVPLMLQGCALVHAGQKQAGLKLIEKANILFLGNDPGRTNFSDAFKRLGRDDLADQQAQIMQRTALIPDWEDEALEYADRQALEAKDFARAAALREKTRLSSLSANVMAVEPGQYVALSLQCRYPLFLQAAARGDRAAILAELDACEKLAPLNINTTIETVKVLDKASDKKLADEVFDRAWQAHLALLRDWPESVTDLNDTAWMAAQCHRKLEEAIKLAEHAFSNVSLGAYMDTLADLHFQLGHRAKAVELETKAFDFDTAAHRTGNLELYQRQLKRFQSGEAKPRFVLPDRRSGINLPASPAPLES